MEFVQHILSYNGSNVCLGTTDSNLFYKYIDELVKKDKSKYQSKYYIDCNFFDEYISTNIISIFLDMFYQSLTFIETYRKNSVQDFIRVEISEGKIKHEIMITFDEQYYYKKERIIDGENHDHYSGMEGSNYIIYDPAYDEKRGDKKDFEINILKEIKNLLNIQSNKPDLEYEFGGELYDQYVEIEKISDKLWFMTKLNVLLNKYWDERGYFEGHILVSKGNDKYYQIEFCCDNDRISLIPEDEKEMLFDFFEPFTGFDEEYTDKDLARDRKVFDEFIDELYETINKATRMLS